MRRRLKLTLLILLVELFGCSLKIAASRFEKGHVEYENSHLEAMGFSVNSDNL